MQLQINPSEVNKIIPPDQQTKKKKKYIYLKINLIYTWPPSKQGLTPQPVAWAPLYQDRYQPQSKYNKKKIFSQSQSEQPRSQGIYNYYSTRITYKF